MVTGTDTPSVTRTTVDRARQILDDFIVGLARRTDLLFAGLMPVQYAFAIIVACFVAPGAWSDGSGQPGAHLWTAIVLGGILTALPVALAAARPGRVANRYVIAVCQMLMCGLIIHLSAGRAEAFLCVYVSLAVLTFYRNFLVVAIASLVCFVDFVFFALSWPSSLTIGWGMLRWLEYSAWIVCEDIFIMIGIHQVLSEWRIASRSLAELEDENRRAMEDRIEKAKELQISLEKLREQEDRTTAILERAYEAFIAIDDQGRVTDWNKQAEYTFGWSKDEILGLTLSKTIIPPEYREAHDRGLQRFLETEQGTILNRSIEMPALHRNGHQFPIELSVTPVRVGKNLTICAFLRDITERKRLIEELALARDKAQEASRLKSQFVANISHEIRTPMNGIIGMSNILLKTALDRKQFEYINTIRDAGRSLLGIINDILDLSKIEAEKLELEIAPFSATELVESTAELLAPQAKAKGLSLMTFVAPQVPVELQGDRERLKQILINLAANAVKFSDKGKVVVSATVESESDLQVCVRFAVADTGVGISDQERSSLFQPFVQADGTISRKYGGTGLGLSISKRLVELMGGEIGVDSVKGQGSTFWFKVPFERPGVPSHVRVSYDSLRTLRVLAIDDDPHATDIIASYLDSWALRSEKAGDPEAALEELIRACCENDPFQVAIIDLRQTSEDGTNQGLQLARRIVADSRIADTRLIMLHDPDDADTSAEALNIGCATALSRPVKQSRLLDSLVQIMAEGAAAPGKKPGKFTQEQAIYAHRRAEQRSELVLIVDDHPINQQVISLYLADLGFDAHIAANGKEAIEAISKTGYELVLMDCQMPELDGLEATRLIRRAEAETGRHVPIVAMTAHAMKGDRENCLAAGMDDYLSKPIDEQDLKAVLERWIPASAARGRAAPPAGPKEVSGSADAGVSPAVTEEELRSVVTRLRTMVGPDKTRMMLEIFLSDSSSSLTRLQDAISSKTGQEVAVVAHYIKGACAMLQATHMQILCAHLEEYAEQQDWERVNSTHQTLTRSFDLLRAAVDEFLGQDDG